MLRSIEYVVCTESFHRERHLTANSSESLGPGEAVPLSQSSDLGFAISCHDDCLVHPLIDTGFEEQRDIVNYDGIRIALGRLSGESGLHLGYTRVDDLFQLSTLCSVMKHDLPEDLPVDRAVGVQDGLSESTHDVPPCRFAWLDNLTRQFIGIDHDGAAFLEHLRHGAFPSGDASRESDQDHSWQSLSCHRFGKKHAIDNPEFSLV